MSNEMITLEHVLKAYDYADHHPHKYLRGTTNWCAAVAHALNGELRALLAKPAEVTGADVLRWMDEHAAEHHQGELVHMVRTHGSCCWEEVGSGSLEDFQSMPEEYELRTLYTRPADPGQGKVELERITDAYRAELDELSQRNYDLRFKQAAQPQGEPVAWPCGV